MGYQFPALMIAFFVMLALPRATAQSGVAQLTNRERMPSVIHKVWPEYSQEAKDRHIEGTVMVRLYVDEEGNPHKAVVIKSVGYGLDQKALEAAAKWKFVPGTRDGVPVRMLATIAVRFSLEDGLRHVADEATPTESTCETVRPNQPDPRTKNSGTPAGVVVEQLAPLYWKAINPLSFAKPPLREGDLIVSWTRGTAHGDLNSPFDWEELVTEQLPHGPVFLKGIRVLECLPRLVRGPSDTLGLRISTVEQQWILRPTRVQLTAWNSFPLGSLPSTTGWGYRFPPGIIVRPPLPPEQRYIYRRCEKLELASMRNGSLATAVAAGQCWREMLTSLSLEQPQWLHLWTRAKMAQSFAEGQSWGDADREFETAVDVAQHVTKSASAQLLAAWGNSLLRRNNYKRAKELYGRALTIRKELELQSFGVARAMDDLADVAARVGAFSDAKVLYDTAARMQSVLGPERENWEAAMSLYSEGEVYMREQDFDHAMTYFTLALKAGLPRETSMALGNIYGVRAGRLISHGPATSGGRCKSRSIVWSGT